MWFWDFMLAVPAPARLLLALILTVGVSVGLTRALYPRLLAMSRQGQAARDASPGVNQANDAVSRFVPFAVIAFIFLTGITVSQFWSNARVATEATSAEASGYTRALTYAQQLPAEAGGARLISTLEGYRISVVDDQWPMLQHAQAAPAYEAQAQAADVVRQAVVAAAESGASGERVWDDLTTAVDDMLLAGTDRIDSVPQSGALTLLMLVLVLGVGALFMLAMASPSYPGLSLMLMGVAGALAAVLMFVAFELSNPFLVASHLALQSVS